MRLCLIALFCLWSPILNAAESVPVDLTKIDRTNAREPAYKGQPHYALLVFGPQAEHKVWFVVDGDKTAYLDRNGNGDLTDPEDRVELDVTATAKIHLSNIGSIKALNVFTLGEVFGTDLYFQLWVRDLKYDNSGDPQILRDWDKECAQHHWEQGSLMRKANDGTQSQNPLLLTAKPADAQISHFGGPLTFDLSTSAAQFQAWPKKSHLAVHIGCRGLLAKDCRLKNFGFTRLTTTEIPSDVHPLVKLELPANGSSTPSFSETSKLDQRCCGDQFYSLLSLPQNASGEAVKVSLSFPLEGRLDVHPAEFLIPINHDVSTTQEQLLILFHDPKLGLKDATRVLRRAGLEVTVESDRLHVRPGKGLVLSIQLTRGDKVQETSKAIGLQTGKEETFSRFDAQFEISISNLDELLKQKTTLRDVQHALLTLTNGRGYSTWNREVLVAPETQVNK